MLTCPDIVDYGLNNTYKALRVIGDTYNLYYSVWCTNEHELYDLTVRTLRSVCPSFTVLTCLQTDPGQVNNLYPSTQTLTEHSLLGIPLSKVLPRLDALLMVTKSCKGKTCVSPWSTIHPAGDVRTLGDALDTRYDIFYATVANTVRFDKCELGYIVESEGPQEAAVFSQLEEL